MGSSGLVGNKTVVDADQLIFMTISMKVITISWFNYCIFPRIRRQMEWNGLAGISSLSPYAKRVFDISVLPEYGNVQARV